MSDKYSQPDAEEPVSTPVNNKRRTRGGRGGDRKAQARRYYQRNRLKRQQYMKLWMRLRRKRDQQTNHEI